MKISKVSASDITCDENHVYHFTTAYGTTQKTDISVTRIINNNVPNLGHIKAAANYGTTVHNLVEKVLNENFSCYKWKKEEFIPDITEGVESASATSLLSKVHELLANPRLVRQLKAPENMVHQFQCNVGCIGKAEYITSNCETKSQFFGGTADAVCISRFADNGKISDRIICKTVFEFKTTKKASNDHILQLAVYMKLLDADIGFVVYDDPFLESAIVCSSELDFCLEEFSLKAARLFLPPIELSEEKKKKMVELSRELGTLVEQEKQLRIQRDQLIQEILSDYAVYEGNDINCGEYKIQKQISKRSTVVDKDDFRSKYPKIYEKYILESATSFMVVRKNGNGEV
jgi:hypothetical protein